MPRTRTVTLMVPHIFSPRLVEGEAHDDDMNSCFVVACRADAEQALEAVAVGHQGHLGKCWVLLCELYPNLDVPDPRL